MKHANIRKADCPVFLNKNGSALMVILGISFILLMAGLFMISMSGQSLFKVKRTQRSAQALAIAEAGIADMVAKLGTNYYRWQESTNYCETSNGAFAVTTRLLPNGNVEITSVGYFENVSNTTIMELLGTLQTHYNDLYDLNSAVLSGGNIEFSSSGYTMNGDLHANQNIISSGGGKNGTITGDVSAVGAIGEFNNIGGVTNTGVPPITFPPTGPFNFDSYRQMATNGGIYYASSQTLSGALPPAGNGIMYVNGDLTIQGGSFTGTIVANGDITITTQFTQYEFSTNSNMPSLLSTGSIDVNNLETFNGVIYARVDVTINNNGTVIGGVISGGNTYIKNSVTITHGAGYPVWDPLNPEVPPEVIVGGWLR